MPFSSVSGYRNSCPQRIKKNLTVGNRKAEAWCQPERNLPPRKGLTQSPPPCRTVISSPHSYQCCLVTHTSCLLFKPKHHVRTLGTDLEGSLDPSISSSHRHGHIALSFSKLLVSNWPTGNRWSILFVGSAAAQALTLTTPVTHLGLSTHEPLTMWMLSLELPVGVGRLEAGSE